MPCKSVVDCFSLPSLLAEKVQRLNVCTLAKLDGFTFSPFITQPIETVDFSQWWLGMLHVSFSALSSSCLVRLIDEKSN